MKSKGEHHFISSIQGIEKSYIVACLNDMLYGQPESFYESMTKRISGNSLNILSVISWDNYYISLTGLPRKIIEAVYNIDYLRYINICVEQITPVFGSVFGKYGLKGITFFLKHNDLKQLVTIFSLGNDDRNDSTVLSKALREITIGIQDVYEKHVFNGDNRFLNIMALSSHLRKYMELRKGFKEVLYLSSHAFFYIQPLVMTYKHYIEIKETFSTKDLQIVYDRLDWAIKSGKADDACEKVDLIFLEYIKKSLSFKLCRSVLEHLRKTFFVTGVMYGNSNVTPKNVFNLGSYANVEQCHASIRSAVETLCEEINSGERILSLITREAVYFIKTHYSGELSLDIIAKHVNVTPSYVSRVFNRDMGTGISDYITNIRIEQAKRLLDSTNDKISKIAENVGFVNARYFSDSFKKRTGLTARQYRKNSNKGLLQ